MLAAILPTSRRRTAVRIFQCALAGALVAGAPGQAVVAAASVVCLLRVLLVRADRAAWLLIAGGLAALAASQTASVHALFAVLAVAGLALLVRPLPTGLGGWLDGAAAGFGAAALVAATNAHLAHPVSALVVIAAVIAALAVRAWQPGASLALLAAGLLLTVAGTEALGALGIALAVWQPAPKQPRHATDGLVAFIAPGAFTAAAAGLLVAARYDSLTGLTLVLASAALGVGLMRMLVAFGELQMLAATRQLAHTDELTGLANRRLFFDRLATILAGGGTGAGPGRNRRLAVLLVDLDRFKEVNDALGHHVGDEILRQIGPRLDGAMRCGDAVARLGGDEFAVLVQSGDEAAAREVAGRVRAAIGRPFHLNGVALHVDASIGVALYPEHGTEPAGLLQRADVAMYVAKGQRSGCEVYSRERDQHRHSPDRLDTIERLRMALTTDEVVVYYQPKADLSTGAVVGAEALVRWADPVRGLVTPDEFVPLAEHAGLMRPLTMHVLERALRQAGVWLADGRPLTVAVNLSASSLVDDDLPAQVARLLDRLGLPGSVLQFEITETVLMADPSRSIQVVSGLRSLGVRIAVDDYGTGYSSLAYLRQLPLDELKLDRCFVSGLDRDPTAAAIVRSTVELAHSLGLRMVAEGVDSEAVWSAVAALGVDVGQGPFVGPPAPAAELTDKVAAAGR